MSTQKRHETYDEDMRGAAGELRHLRGGNLLNERKVFQNKPETPDLSPLNTTKPVPEISTEPKEPETIGNANLLIGGVSPNCNAHETMAVVY
jgi:hypothetical protein